MKRFDKITRPACREIADLAEDALNAALADHNLRAVSKGGSYDSARFTVKFDISLADVDVLRKDFEAMAPSFGVPRDAYQKTVQLRGEVYQVTGLNPRASRYPVAAKRVRDGKPFKLPAAVLDQLVDQA